MLPCASAEFSLTDYEHMLIINTEVIRDKTKMPEIDTGLSQH